MAGVLLFIEAARRRAALGFVRPLALIDGGGGSLVPSASASVSVAASFVDAQGLEAFLDAYGEFEAMRSLVEHGAGVIT